MKTILRRAISIAEEIESFKWAGFPGDDPDGVYAPINHLRSLAIRLRAAAQILDHPYLREALERLQINIDGNDFDAGVALHAELLGCAGWLCDVVEKCGDDPSRWPAQPGALADRPTGSKDEKSLPTKELDAVPWTTVEQETQAESRSDAWGQCSELAKNADILQAFEVALRRVGVVGEIRLAKLLYLALTSRLLDRPVSIAVKGPSSAGKSYIVESVLRFFPPEAYHALTALSDKALAYSTEDLRHRHLIIYEAAGMAGEFASYLIRSLLSEGRLRYETVVKTQDGPISKVIEQEGPTGLILTTTSLKVHPENETRLLSATVTDTRAQTRAIIEALASESDENVDLSRWRALQGWLANLPAKVIIPFAKHLARLVPPVAVRLRRDFASVLMLMRAHALLHQATRQKDERGRIVVELGDYAVVRDLMADIVAQGVEASLKPETREVVKAVGELIASGHQAVMQTQIAAVLQLDTSTVSRRIDEAIRSPLWRSTMVLRLSGDEAWRVGFMAASWCPAVRKPSCMARAGRLPIAIHVGDGSGLSRHGKDQKAPDRRS